MKKCSNRLIFHTFLACHLKLDADLDPAYYFDRDPDYHFDADPDPTFQFDEDPDPQHWWQGLPVATVLQQNPKFWSCQSSFLQISLTFAIILVANLIYKQCFQQNSIITRCNIYSSLKMYYIIIMHSDVHQAYKKALQHMCTPSYYA